MSTIAPVQPGGKTVGDYRATAAEIVEAIRRLDDEMDQRRAVSERLIQESLTLKAETQAIKARVAASLDRLEEQVNQLRRAA